MKTIKAWWPIVAIFVALFLFSLLISSCNSESRDDRYQRIHPEFKAVVLSISEHTMKINGVNHYVYRLKDIEENVIFNRTFSIYSHYYECGDTITLRR